MPQLRTAAPAQKTALLQHGTGSTHSPESPCASAAWQGRLWASFHLSAGITSGTKDLQKTKQVRKLALRIDTIFALFTVLAACWGEKAHQITAGFRNDVCTDAPIVVQEEDVHLPQHFWEEQHTLCRVLITKTTFIGQ